MTSLHKTAIAAGAELASAYEFNGEMQPATYTLTLEQLEVIVTMERLKVTVGQGKKPTQTKKQDGEHWFHANFIAILTQTKATDWTLAAGFSMFEKEFGPSFRPLFGSDIFAAYRFSHPDGRVAQVEYCTDDYIYLSCGAVSWTGPLEDDIVRQAEKLSSSKGLYASVSIA